MIMRCTLVAEVRSCIFRGTAHLPCGATHWQVTFRKIDSSAGHVPRNSARQWVRQPIADRPAAVNRLPGTTPTHLLDLLLAQLNVDQGAVALNSRLRLHLMPVIQGFCCTDILSAGPAHSGVVAYTAMPAQFRLCRLEAATARFLPQAASASLQPKQLLRTVFRATHIGMEEIQYRNALCPQPPRPQVYASICVR